MNGPAMVAEHFGSRTHDIVDAWREAVRRDDNVPQTESLTRAELDDHIPQLLGRMADRLRGRPADLVGVAERHGHVRWRQGYDIGEVVVELGHLRAALVQATLAWGQQDGGPDAAAVESALLAIGAVLDEAAAESVRQFQEDSQAELERQGQALEQERLTAETAQGRLSAVLASLPVGVWVTDADGVIVAANSEAEQLQGFPAERAVNRVNVHDLGPEYDLRRPDGTPLRSGEAPLARALQGEAVDHEEVLWPLNGADRVVVVNAAPLADAAGRPAGAVAVGQDVTRARRVAAELAVASAQLQSIVEQSPVMIWRAAPDGRCDFVNRTWLAFRGRPLDQLLAEGWAGGIHPDDRDAARAEYRDAFARRAPFELAYRLLRRDGQYRWVTDHGTPYFDAEGRFLGYLGSALDIHERIDLEAALEEQKRRAEEASAHKTRLMSALSHDARTPLNAVFLSVQLLEMHVGAHPEPEVQECLRTIRHSVRNVLDLMGDLLNLTKIDAGADPAELSRFELVPVLAECLASIEPQARQKGLDCRLEPDGLGGLTVESDRSKLKQILSNLLSNALRFTERGHVRLYGDRSDGRLRIAVEDTGLGIAPEDQARIFDEFARLEQPNRPIGEGTGLGLAICRRLALLLGGEISLSSTPGRGSTFTLSLPESAVVGEDQAPTPSAADGVPAPGAPAAAGVILVVEDHDTSRQALARVLRRLGYGVAEADNGRDALELARRERPRAILMDVNMPIMDGIDATLALRADPALRDVPIFALTGDVSTVNQRRIGEAGVDGYLEKPVTAEALGRALSSLNGQPSG